MIKGLSIPPSWRMPAFYFLHFFGVGVTLPFLNVYYYSVGITAVQLGYLNAAARFSTSLAPPLVGVLADRLGRGREIMLFCVALGSFLALGLWWSQGFWALLFLVTLYSASRGAVGPIAENTSLRQVEKSGGQYGRLRWWGSLGFIVAAMGVGRIIEAYSIGWMFPVLFGSGMILLLVVRTFPQKLESGTSHFRRDLKGLLKSKPLLHFFGSAILAAISAGPFGLYFSIYLRELGMSAMLIGLAWTIGVVSEIFFLWYAHDIQKRIGLKAMIAAGIFALALRWEFTTWTTNIVALLAIQMLHGVTFGIYHVGAVQFVDKMSGDAIKNTGQALYTAATFGVGSTFGALLAGWLLPQFGFVTLMHWGAALATISGVWFVLLTKIPSEDTEVSPDTR
ncbi:MAG: MFS transporter [Nitrospinaceae bacterium]|jgi:MFS transporter, PPP family, 3-phenylpropionic acid transporter|nr:MFS transporter [Nitrospinaceae bacterium]MBT3433865.1 MFS transporter [Nitrospinaceae bacterium]MBT3820395.1 MFS transporter [Nitrospinaceae bacterium]MBT4095433.1 MFS transporter [Nitrospinaceae bacterium]MBT4429006.1 MFS transporter [Nitrospinaceae bacterium]